MPLDHRRVVGVRQQHGGGRGFYSNRAGCLPPNEYQSGARFDADVARGDDWRNVYARRNFDEPGRARIRPRQRFGGFFDV